MEMFPINKLLEEHHDSTVIYNRAVGGFITDELLKVIDVCAVDLMPSKVFINIGTNDLSWSSIPISQVIDNYSKILDEIEKVPDVKIYLMAYYPVNYEAAAPEMKECLKIRTNEKIAAANAEVKKLAERHGQRYIDISRNLKDDRGSAESGIHHRGNAHQGRGLQSHLRRHNEICKGITSYQNTCYHCGDRYFFISVQTCLYL